MEALDKSTATEILFHHRIPTSTNNTVGTNHPIVAINKIYKHNYWFIHNGIIGNDFQLKTDHEKLGIKYNTEEDYRFNDSEALMHELILVIEGIKKPEEFAAKGSIAFILLQTNKNDKAEALYYGRWGNPLKLTYIKGMMILRSEHPNASDIEENKLFRYDYKTKETTSQDIKFGQPVFRLLPEKTVSKSNDLSKFAEVLRSLFGYCVITTSSLKEFGPEEMTLLLVSARRIRREAQLKWESEVISKKYVSDTFWAQINYNFSVSNLLTITSSIEDNK